MFRTKTDVDRHVAKTLAKLKTEKDRNYRGYSIARLYFDIGDFESCCRYAGMYLTEKSNNPAAHMLLGQAFQKLGNPDRALAEYKASLDIQPNQMNLILKVCELLSTDTSWDTGRSRYWVERAATLFPQHPAVFRLRQRLLASQGADPADLVALASAEAAARPADAAAHARLLRRLAEAGQPAEAFKHAFRSHFATSSRFADSSIWREAVVETLTAHAAHAPPGFLDRDYWLLRLAVFERGAETALAEGRSPAEATAALRSLDGATGEASAAMPPAPSDALAHYGGQICLHAATLLLKKGSGERGGWREAVSSALPLLLTATMAPVPDSGSFRYAAAYRRSQAGRTLLACVGDRGHRAAEKAVRCLSAPRWRNELYVKLFGDAERPLSSYILLTSDFESTEANLPEASDLKRCEEMARSLRPDSLHLQVWLGLASEKLSDVVAPAVEGLPTSVANLANCGAETLNAHDIDAFLYCTVLTASEHALEAGERDAARPTVLPAALSRQLCTPDQIKWWECAHALGRLDSGDAGDARRALSRGIETVRGVGNHGLDPQLLCALADTFGERAVAARDPAQKRALEARATLYYTVAVPMIRKLRENVADKPPKGRLFDYTSGDASPVRLDALADRAKLYLAARHAAQNDDDKAIEILDAVKSPYASFQLYKIYRKMADDQVTSDRESLTSENRSRNIILLTKARDMIYLTSERLAASPFGSDHPLRAELGEHIESVEASLSRIDPDMNPSTTKQHDQAPSSTGDSSAGSDRPVRTRENRRRHHNSHRAQPSTEGLEGQIRQLQLNSVLTTFIEQMEVLIKSNRTLVEELREMKKSMKSDNADATAEKLEMHKISTDGLKSAVEGYRNESAGEVAALKAEVAELKREVNALKVAPQQRERTALDDSELLLLEEETYAANTANILPYLPRAPTQYPMYQPGAVYPVYPGQYPGVQLFPQVFQPDRTTYRDPAVPPAHNYQITLPPDPPVLFPLSNVAEPARGPVSASTPVVPKPAPIIPFNLFDTPQAKLAQASAASSSFGNFTSPVVEYKTPDKSRTLSERSGDSYDPMPDFKPVVDLPDEIHVTTGEEDEEVLFDERAKLYRFVAKEWKERGIGQIKLLKNSKSGKVRVLMRRERVHKICANHFIAPDVEISRMKKDDAKAYFWATNDFADETVVLEKFCIRFKTVELGEKFYDTFCKARDDTTTLSKVPNAAISTGTVASVTGFGDKFKPKAGSWKCEACYTNNDDTTSQKCIACGGSKPTPVSVPSAPVSTFGGITFFTAPTFTSTPDKVTVTNDPAPPKPNPFAGFTFNKPAITTPIATVMDAKNETVLFDGKVKLSTSREKTPGTLKLLADQKDKRKVRLVMTSDTGEVRFDRLLEADTVFERSPLRDGELTCTRAGLTVALAFEPATNRAVFESAIADARKGWGDAKSALADMFKPKPGSWTCKSCYINNEGTAERCVACDTPLNPSAPTPQKTPTPFKFGSGDTPTVTATPVFGFLDHFKPKAGSWSCKSCYVDNEPSAVICAACTSPKDPNAITNEPKPLIAPTSKFTFGIPNTANASPAAVFGGFITTPTTAASTPIFGGFTPMANTTVTSFGGFTSLTSATSTPSTFSFGIDKSKDVSLEVKKPEVVTHNGKFQFTFKPKTGAEDKESETKGEESKEVGQDEKDDEKYHDDDDGDHLIFEPIIPLPDKVEVKTGEEDEEVLYSHLAKLYRFDTREWKECGVGDVKLLKHRLTSKLRVVMRRNPTLKISLNHALTADVVYTAKDTKTWLFHANDFSSEEITPQRFCLRFKTPEIANEFKEAVESAREQSDAPPQKEPEVILPESVFNLSSDSDFNKTSDSQVTLGAFKFATPKGLEFAFGDAAGAQKDTQQLPNGQFKFTFNPKTPVTPAAKEDQGHESGDEHYASDNEGDHLVFEPVVPLPDEVEVKTGEEEEVVLYSHRAKLYRFDTGEWKECGVGDIKILKHPDTGKIRVLMRRTPTLKICLNHALTPDISYTNKDHRSFVFSANDYSSGEIVPTNFCVRFRADTAADEFLAAIEAARSSFPKNETPEDEIVVVSESVVSEEDKAFARTLQLPEKFFAYRQREPCPGCIGCEADSDTENPPEEPVAVTPVVTQESPVSIFSGQKSIFGGGEGNIFGMKHTVGQTVPLSGIGAPPTTKVFQLPPFGSSTFGSTPQTVFGSASPFAAKPIIASTFGATPLSVNVFGSGDSNSLWNPSPALKVTSEPKSLNDPKPLIDNKLASVTKSGAVLFGKSPLVTPSAKPAPPPAFALNAGATVDFSALAKMQPNPFATTETNGPFTWAGAGTPLFGAKPAKTGNDSSLKFDDSEAKDSSATGDDGEYDPYYAPVISMPDEIDVVTGEEDEEVELSDRCKLFRFTDSEWKERARGIIKILKHRTSPLYRLLMRQDQVHKCVLNQRITVEMQLQPMAKSKNALVWAGLNYTSDHPQGTPEQLAVRFSTEDAATAFSNKFNDVQQAILKGVEEVHQDQEQYETEQEYDDDANYEGEYDYGEEEEDEDEEGELSIVWSCDAVVDGSEAKLNLLSSGEGSGRLQLLSTADNQIIKDLPVTPGDSVQFEGGECVVRVAGEKMNATLPSESEAVVFHASFEEILS